MQPHACKMFDFIRLNTLKRKEGGRGGLSRVQTNGPQLESIGVELYI